MWEHLVQFVLWLLREQGCRMVIAVIIIAVLGGSLFILYQSPVLFDAKSLTFITRYPSYEPIPDKKKDRLRVLSQRKIMYFDRWILQDPIVDCLNKENRLKCTEMHIYESWTFIVPEEPDKIHLHSMGFTTGKRYPIPVALSPHQVHKLEGSKENNPQWYVDNNAPPGTTDVVFLFRALFGGYQPRTPNLLMEPEIDLCKGDSAFIFLRDPTARVEFIIMFSDERLAKPGEYKLWKKIGSLGVVPVDGTKAGTVESATGKRIYWKISKNLLDEVEQGDLSLYISWLWEKPSQSVKGKGRGVANLCGGAAKEVAIPGRNKVKEQANT